MPPWKRKATAKQRGGFDVVGSGSGGFDEIEAALDEGALCFGLMRFTIGAGTFARVKWILLHFIGANVTAMRRGRGNARKAEAVKALGPCHADLVFNGREELEEERVLERLLQVFTADNLGSGGGGRMSIAQLRADYARMLQEAKEKAERAAKDQEERAAKKREKAEAEERERRRKVEEERAKAEAEAKAAEARAAEAKAKADAAAAAAAAAKAKGQQQQQHVHLAPLAMDCDPPLTAEECVKYVRDPTGPYNWLLVEAKPPSTPNSTATGGRGGGAGKGKGTGKGAGGGGLTLVNAGARGSNEMSVYVRDEQVYFGLLRLAFGTGRYRRTKWAFVSWSGEKMPFMRRGPAKMAEGAISALLRPFNLSFHFQHREQLELEEVIAEMLKVVVVDGDAERDAFSVEAALAAMQEQEELNAAYFEEVAEGEAGGGGAQEEETEEAKEAAAEAAAAEEAAQKAQEEAEEMRRKQEAEKEAESATQQTQEHGQEPDQQQGAEPAALSEVLRALRAPGDDGGSLTWLLVEPASSARGAGARR